MAEIKWKTQQEIEDERNAPQTPTDAERIEALEKAMLLLLMEG